MNNEANEDVLSECITNLFVKAWYIDVVNDDFGLSDDLIGAALKLLALKEEGEYVER